MITQGPRAKSKGILNTHQLKSNEYQRIFNKQYTLVEHQPTKRHCAPYFVIFITRDKTNVSPLIFTRTAPDAFGKWKRCTPAVSTP
jgi:hypothetical protein